VHEAAGTFGVLCADADGRVFDFQEKPAHPLARQQRAGHALVSMGIYAADLDVLQGLLALDANDPLSSHDFGRDVLPRAAAEGLLAIHNFDSSCVRTAGRPVYWRDVGSLDQYWNAQHELTLADPPLDLFDPAWPLLGRPLARPPTRVAPGRGAADGVSGCLVGAGCRIEVAAVRGSVLSDACQVGAGSVVEDAVLLPGAAVGPGSRLRKVIVDEQCTLPAGLVVGFDADEDRARFHVTPAGVTLVTAAMLRAPADAARRPLSTPALASA
jgi:glucose-1-phosphate adenylyltransferase